MSTARNTAQRKRSPDEQAMLSRQGGFLANARVTPEQKRQYGAKGLRVLITRKVDPDGQLARTNPREFERRYTLELKAHMAWMGAQHSAKAAEKRAAKAAQSAGYAPMVLLSACPVCNAEAGYTVPLGYKQELCFPHTIAANRAAINAVLDEAQERAQARMAS